MKKYIYSAFAFLILTLSIPPLSAEAASATLYLSPSSRNYDAGSSFTVTVYVSTDTSMNAASGVISFPADMLQVTSISKSGSIFSLWAQEPSYSNSAGTVSFEGVVLNPGYSGSAGKLLSITFRARAAGSALVRFSSGSVLANDGEGTNILSSMGSGQYTIGDVGPEAPVGTTVETATNAPRAPAVSSVTHPDPTKWYASRNAKFSWDLPQGTTGVRLLYGKSSNAIPTESYIPPISVREIADIPDGAWYLHAQLRNDEGWGGVTHFRFQVDTGRPSRFEITEVVQEKPSARAKFSFVATDAVSGIGSYEVRIDGGDPQIWVDETRKGIYEAPSLEPGKHTLIAKAFDKAGNSISASVDFEIIGLDAPKIIDYPKELRSGEPLVVRGTTLPNAKMTARIIRGDGEKLQSFTSEADGKFTFVSDEDLVRGAYKVSFRAENEDGAKTFWSEPVAIAVGSALLSRIAGFIVDSLSSIVIIIGVALLLVVLSSFFLKKFSHLRKDVKSALSNVETSIHSHFDELREDVTEALRILEHTSSKRELTKEEDRLRKHLAKSLASAEKAIEKEFKDLEKKIK